MDRIKNAVAVLQNETLSAKELAGKAGVGKAAVSFRTREFILRGLAFKIANRVVRYLPEAAKEFGRK